MALNDGSLGSGEESPKRNPRWTEEELILALDLYLRCGTIAAESCKVRELSQLLRNLSIYPDSAITESFRNLNGVALKLANFAAIDPNYVGRGMNRFSKRDVAVWNKYSSDVDALAAIAVRIREGQELPTTATQLDQSEGPGAKHST